MAKKKFKKSDDNLIIDLASQILEHCKGKNLGDVACFVGTLACGTLHRAAEVAHIDVKQYLLAFSDTLRDLIEVILKDYSFKP